MDEFVYEIAWEESSLEKHHKIDGLKLSTEEWKCIKKLLELLKVSLTNFLLP